MAGGGNNGNDDDNDRKNNNSSNTNHCNLIPLDNPPPPSYTSVLLDHHLDFSRVFGSLYPTDLIESIRMLAEHHTYPPNHAYRTYHALTDVNFGEGSGSYYGEIDPKRRRHGYGNMVYVNGDRYMGFWRKNVRDGEGAYFWAETGSVYAGLWKANERNGSGHFVFGPRRKETAEPDRDWDSMVFTGEWIRGRVRGQGQIRIAAREDNDNHNVVQMVEQRSMERLFGR